MVHNYFLCTRGIRGKQFTNSPGECTYLKVPEGKLPAPSHAIAAEVWTKEVYKQAVWGKDERDTKRDRGDLLVFVHGYNNGPNEVLERHERLKKDLAAVGYKGEVIAFIWPSSNRTLAYLPDRHAAKRTAMELVDGGIALLAKMQSADCTVNVHLLGHSTGAYVIREAFDDADDCKLEDNAWHVGQIVFIAGDVSSNSMRSNNGSSASLYRHCTRLTNYFSGRDSVLKLSNAKRVGISPRVGRVGLPEKVPGKAVDVDCTGYFRELEDNEAVRARDQVAEIGSFQHSWYIGNRLFIRDLFEVIKGDLDRESIPTRRVDTGGNLHLHAAQEHEA